MDIGTETVVVGIGEITPKSLYTGFYLFLALHDI